jgi:hypothetical protein
MTSKRLHTAVRLSHQDVDFLKDIGFEENLSEGVRFAIKLTRMYSLPAIKKIGERESGGKGRTDGL